MKKRVIVVLKLHKLSVPKKIEKARFIVSSMSGNERFPNPSPGLNVIQERASALEGAYIAAQGGGTDDTALMYVREDELDKALIKLGHYVEDIANENIETAEAIILSAGMEPKKDPVHTAREFNVKNSGFPGRVEMETKYLDRASYIWEYTITPDDPASWKTAGTSIKASFVKDGLTPETHYFFRVATVTKDGQGPWSREFELLVL